ncbi:IRK-interacting protein-like protein [Drosera capensis]
MAKVDYNGEDIQAAIAKGVELRALHAAAAAAGNPVRLMSSSPVGGGRPNTVYSAQSYPVFTPTYEDEPLPRYQQLQLETQTLPDWEDYGLGDSGQESALKVDYKGGNASSRKALTPRSINSEPHFSWKEEAKSALASYNNQITALQSSPTTDVLNPRRRRNSLGDTKSTSIYSRVVNNSRPSKNQGTIFSWLSRLKKKDKSENSPAQTDAEEVSQVLKNMGITSTEMLKKELIEAVQKKDAALKEVVQMKTSFEDLNQKLDSLEDYCEELKRALREALQPERPRTTIPKCAIQNKGSRDGDDSMMPVSEQGMVEGFLQVISESRLSLKHFSKALIAQIEKEDVCVVESINLLLHPHKFSPNAKYSKAVLYHMEAIINQQLYQDFENCVFQRNGSAKLLDPKLDRQAQFSSFVALRNLSWTQVLKKGTKYYSEEFSKFCDQKMSCIIAALNWTKKWPEQLLQSFFVAAKCIWLLHLLAFSFYPPLMIQRVKENRLFDGQYMEDVFAGKEKRQSPSRVKVMVMPGFYVQDKVLRCRVLCK